MAQCWFPLAREKPSLNLQGVEIINKSALGLPDTEFPYPFSSFSGALHQAKMRQDPKPGDVPSCMIFDEMYAHDRGWGTIGNPSNHQSKAQHKSKVTHTVPAVPANTPWGVVHLAYSNAASIGTFQARKLGSNFRQLEDNPQEDGRSDHARLSNVTRRKVKALKELPMSERPLGLLESSAINVGTAVATEEERQQNIAAMEMFQPEWLCIHKTRSRSRPDHFHSREGYWGTILTSGDGKRDLSEIFCDAGERAWISGQQSQPLNFKDLVISQKVEPQLYHTSTEVKHVKPSDKVAKDDRTFSLRERMQALRTGSRTVETFPETYPYPYGKEVHHLISSQLNAGLKDVNLSRTQLYTGQEAEPKRQKPIFLNASLHSMPYPEPPNITNNVKNGNDAITRDGTVLFSLLSNSASARTQNSYKISFPSYVQVRSPDIYCQPFPLQQCLRRPSPSRDVDTLESSIAEKAILDFTETNASRWEDETVIPQNEGNVAGYYWERPLYQQLQEKKKVLKPQTKVSIQKPVKDKEGPPNRVTPKAVRKAKPNVLQEKKLNYSQVFGDLSHHLRLFSMLKKAVECRRAVKIERLKSLLANKPGNQKSARVMGVPDVDSSDLDDWHDAYGKLAHDRLYLDQDFDSSSAGEDECQVKTRKERFLRQVNKPRLYDEEKAKYLDYLDKKIMQKRNLLSRLPRLQFPRYVKQPLSRNSVLQLPVAASGWARQNQTASKSGIMFFEIRGNVLLYYIPKPAAVGGTKRRSKLGFLRYKLPLDAENFPPHPAPDEIILCDGLVICHSSTITECKTDAMSPLETVIVPQTALLKMGTPEDGAKHRRSSLATAASNFYAAQSNAVFPPRSWRVLGQPFIAVSGLLLSTVSPGGPSNQGGENEKTSSVDLCSLCLQGRDVKTTVDWLNSLRALKTAEQYISSCLRIPKVYPSRLLIASIHDVIKQHGVQGVQLSTEFYVKDHFWRDEVLVPFLQNISTLHGHKSIAFSNGTFAPLLSSPGAIEALKAVLSSRRMALDVSYNALSRGHLQKLAHLLEETTCQLVDLSGCEIDDTGAEDLLKIMKSSVESILINDNRMTTDTLKKWIEILNSATEEADLKLKKLRYVMCSKCLKMQIFSSEESTELFRRCVNSFDASAEKFTAVVASGGISVEGVEQRRVEKASNVHEKLYNIEHGRVVEVQSMVSLISPFASELDLSASHFCNPEEFTDIIQNLFDTPHCIHLRLSYCTGEMHLNLARFSTTARRRASLLRILPEDPRDSARPVFTSEGHEKFPPLRSLRMEGNAFRFDKMDQCIAMATFVANSEIRLLDISGSQYMREAPAETVAFFLNLLIFKTSLEELYLEECGITGSVIAELASTSTAMRRRTGATTGTASTLSVLSLACNRLVEEDIGSLISSLCNKEFCPYLSHLDVSGNLSPLKDLAIVRDTMHARYPRFDIGSLILEPDLSDINRVERLRYQRQVAELEKSRAAGGDAAEIEKAVQNTMEMLWEEEQKKLQTAKNERTQARRQRRLALQNRTQRIRHRIQERGGRTDLISNPTQYRNIRIRRLQRRQQLVELLIDRDPYDTLISYNHDFMPDAVNFVESPETGAALDFSEREFDALETVEAMKLILQRVCIFDALYLSGMDLRDADFAALVAVCAKSSWHIRTLDLSFNLLTSKIQSDIIAVVRTTGLSKLNLDGNFFHTDDQATVALIEALSLECPALRYLSLRGVSLSEKCAAGLRALATQRSQTSSVSVSPLRRLRLQHNALSLEALEDLLYYAAATYPALKRLDMGGMHPNLDAAMLQKILEKHSGLCPYTKQVGNSVTYKAVFSLPHKDE